ncbi:hypothetical protein BO70DRAFT_393223 [Aspergillus heteromorphus CBS 117.55]|uniref:Orotidine 5'-phosphate decarboxylase domain-containing protein n=1 Tax=Aspergillus heteromorphus CBS 117.55 TaxID=1448321 RepID=A0A317WUK6_9EURO|nr:uncharacterized protein BO70DRAFT_393223 [Aspergillus heteromorphus CBS 117.55]PWY90036.1 hypothetical protein BO70DRAFT_393223 [Aspergillus heteromorphus CBS 117.55]
MDSSSPSVDGLPGNRIIAYLETLAKTKTELPYGLPVSVMPSHTITTTDALLHLAASVHADIIDDWSEETVRQLVSLARKHGFLIWESGRVLNSTIDVVGRQKAEARELRNGVVDLIRKKYTKGVVKPAAWAGLSTAWASGAAVYNQEADILIPTLKAAAREAVADTAQTIRTEITAENLASDYYAGGDQDAQSQHLSEYAVDHSGLGPPRKASTISLTQTISQHTEDSTDYPLESPQYERHGFEFGTLSPSAIPEDLPPPPLLARGLVLCLPSMADTAFTPAYRQSCIAAARANQDFVVGFLSGEPWHLVSQKSDLFEMGPLAYEEEQQQLSPYSSDDDEALPRFAMFSAVSLRLAEMNSQSANEDEDVEDDEMAGSASPETSLPVDSLNPLAAKLFDVAGKALKLRESSRLEGGKSGNKNSQILHIPLVSLP